MFRSLISAGLLAVAGIAWYLLVHGGSPVAETHPTGLDGPDSPAPAASAQPAVPPPGETAQAAPAPADLPPGMTAEEAQVRRRLMELEAAAEARFAQAVDLDGLRGGQVAEPVRRLFDSLSLEPVFDPQQGGEGLVEGLRIAEMSSSNPLAGAGFEVGDRLVRLGGQPLVDPAQIAYTMIALGADFEVCAARESGSYCRTVSLEG